MTRVTRARSRPIWAVAMVAVAAVGCLPAASGPPVSPSTAAVLAEPTPSNMAGPSSLIIVGRVMTMDDPPLAEALLIENGIVTAIGTRADVLPVAGDEVPVIDIGQGVAYPGFIDAHAHWIGDRDRYDIDSPEAAMVAAMSRGWTSIAEQWVNPERLRELETLVAGDSLPMRVDAYLALNFGSEFLGDWYVDSAPGAVDDHLRVRGLKIHLDDGPGKTINWEPADLTATIARANAADWQVSVHSMSSAALALALDAFEAAIGPDGPNPLHHLVEHLIDVKDEQLARLVAMDIAGVIHLDGAADWLLDPGMLDDFDRDDPGEIGDRLARWRDFVDAGLHVASASDAPWTFYPDLSLSDGVGRAVDQIAAGLDGRVRSRPAAPSWLLDQLLTAEQGLRAVTMDAAWALGDEKRRGHLAVGTLGDVTILSGDVTSATPDEIRAMDVIATIVGGRVVFCAEAEVCDSPR